MTKYLIKHGANVNYYDHALRNALYWSVYSCATDITLFLLNAGAVTKPWSWLEDDSLPINYCNDETVYQRMREARSSPAPLLVLARAALRSELSVKSSGRTIFPLVNAMKVGEDLKNILLLEQRSTKSSSRTFGGVVAANKAKKKLEKLCNETKV